MKKNKFIYMIVALLTVTIFALAWASPTEEQGDMKWTGKLTFTGAIQGLNALIFEGATEDAFETTFTITEPTADNTITIPDGDWTIGTVGNHTAATSITVTDTTTNTVTDLLIIDHSGGDTTTGFGTGVSFLLEDDTGTTTEQHGSIDVVITDGTSTTEESDIVFSAMSNGDVSEQLRIVSAEGATTGDYLLHTSNTTETNTTLDTLRLQTAGTTAATGGGLGLGITFSMPDDGDATVNQNASIEAKQTSGADGAEQVNFVFSQMVAGTEAETLRIVGNSGATSSDYLEFFGNTSETDGIVPTGRFKITPAAAGASGIGQYWAWFLPDTVGTPVEEAVTMTVTYVDATDTSEDADFYFSNRTAGAVKETLRGVANSSATTGDYLQFTQNTTDDNAVLPALVLTQSNGASTATTGNGLSISFRPEDAGGAEEQASIGVVFTDATDATEDTDLVISVQDAGGIVEHTRFESDGGIYMEGATSDGNQLILLPNDPAADRTINLPSTTNAAAMISSLVTNDVDVANSIWGVSNGLAFGGATGANGFEVTVSPGADPGADVALTLPTASGAIPTVIGTGSFKTVESLTATDVQTSADCGKTLLLTHATVAIVVTLPAPAGLSGCEFWVRHNLATNQDHTVVTNASANIIRGSIAENQGAAGSYQAAGDVITFVNTAESVGDYIHLITDGTSWFVDGLFELNGGITQGST